MSDDNTIEERIFRLLENLVLQGNKIEEDSNLSEDLDLDSLSKIELMMDLEDEFDIVIPDEVMAYLDAVDDLVGYIERVLKQY